LFGYYPGMGKKRPWLFTVKGATTLAIVAIGVAVVAIVVTVLYGPSRRDVTKVDTKVSRLIEYLDGLPAAESEVRLPFEKGRRAMAEQKWDNAIAFFEQAKTSASGAQLVALMNYVGQCHYEQVKYEFARADFELAAKLAASLRDSTGEATALNNQAGALRSLGRYADAEPLYKRALAIDEKALGKDHPDVATALNNLAALYDAQGKYAEAEPLFKRALAIVEKQLGPEHPDVAQSLNNLAGLYQAQGKYAEAEPLFKRALAIREKALPSDHPDIAQSLNNLAGLYDAQGKYSSAEPLFKRAVDIMTKSLGPDHPNTKACAENLRLLREKMKK
jgi:tetratricopeptide (TPR) repeat protein